MRANGLFYIRDVGSNWSSRLNHVSNPNLIVHDYANISFRHASKPAKAKQGECNHHVFGIADGATTCPMCGKYMARNRNQAMDIGFPIFRPKMSRSSWAVAGQTCNFPTGWLGGINGLNNLVDSNIKHRKHLSFAWNWVFSCRFFIIQLWEGNFTFFQSDLNLWNNMRQVCFWHARLQSTLGILGTF